jgi:hypothetical protein
MKSEKETPLKPAPLVVWQESAQPNAKNQSKIVDLDQYRRAVEPESEATIISWELPSTAATIPVKLLLISSGFMTKGLGGSSIHSMAA